MDGATFLTRVVLENYKSIAHCDVRLGPLNYLVGPNGAGKSNFLDALEFIADSLNQSPGKAILSRGGLGEICHARHPGRDFQIALEFHLPDNTEGSYSVHIGTPDRKNDRWAVLAEECLIHSSNPRAGSVSFSRRGEKVVSSPSVGDMPVVLYDRLLLPDAASRPVFRPIFDALSRMRFYHIQPQAVTDVETFEPGAFLASDGSNLTSVIARLQLQDQGVAVRINDYLRIILPGLIHVRAEPVQSPTSELPVEAVKFALIFQQRLSKGVHLFWASQMSDGTRHALGILVALLQANVESGQAPALVAIEEPEAQVNPAVLGVLRDAMLEASYCTQVLVTTHSSDLLDNKDVLTESLIAVLAEEGVTRIGPIDEGARDLIHRRLYTPGELLRIGQVFPEDGKRHPSCSLGSPVTTTSEEPA